MPWTVCEERRGDESFGRDDPAYRRVRGLSSRALAAAAVLAPQTVWFIENGVTRQPRQQNLEAIARVLGIPPLRL